MSIIDVINDNKAKKVYAKSIDDAVKIFEQQKNALKKIKNTEGLKEIKDYFKREKEASMRLIMNSSKNNEKEKGRYELADNFLKFVDRLVSEQ